MKPYRLPILLVVMIATVAAFATTEPLVIAAPTVADLRRNAAVNHEFSRVIGSISPQAEAYFTGKSDALLEVADWLERSQMTITRVAKPVARQIEEDAR